MIVLSIILCTVLWFCIGYVISCLFERVDGYPSSSLEFFLTSLLWPITLFLIIIVSTSEYEFNIKASKFRKWLRGF